LASGNRGGAYVNKKCLFYKNVRCAGRSLLIRARVNRSSLGRAT